MTPLEITNAIETVFKEQSLVPIWTYILLIILPMISAYFGSYLKKSAENRAINENVEKALNGIEAQVNSVKSIEERITHFYLEEREISRVKREKIELIYESMAKEVEQIGENLSSSIADIRRDILFSSNKTQMLISLYFKDDMAKELRNFLEQRVNLTT